MKCNNILSQVRIRGQAGRETRTTNQKYRLGKGSVQAEDRNKSLHIDMLMEKRRIQRRRAPRKLSISRGNLRSENWIRRRNWVHIAKYHMYPKKKGKGVFYSKDLREIRVLCMATLLHPDLEKDDKSYPNRRKLKRRFKCAVGEDGLTGRKCYSVTVIYDRMENEVVTAFPSLYWTLRRLRYSRTSI